MTVKYENLKNTAKTVKEELSRKGIFMPGRVRARRKPRSPEKRNLLYLKAMNRAEEFKPCYNDKKELILPYFSK
ncbi:MAG: hypothetical protein AB1632_12795 [Nitrospirota bacterium]